MVAAKEEEGPYRIAFNVLSSRDRDRRLDFTKQINYLKSRLSLPFKSKQQVHIKAYTLWNMTLQEQVRLATQTDIFVTACGGGSMTATFLPRGASLLVYYNSTGGLDFASLRSNKAAARLDWDLLNNAAHLRAHWLPIDNMDQTEGLDLLLQFVQHEINILQQERKLHNINDYHDHGSSVTN